MTLRIDNLDFGKGDGLLPVITQDAKTKQVLMLAYANREAVDKTLRTGIAHYWSRSRGKLWQKGETSGNIQKIISIEVDCDNDSLIYVVESRGPACHTGNTSCFYRGLNP